MTASSCKHLLTGLSLFCVGRKLRGCALCQDAKGHMLNSQETCFHDTLEVALLLAKNMSSPALMMTYGCFAAHLGGWCTWHSQISLLVPTCCVLESVYVIFLGFFSSVFDIKQAL